MRTFIFLGTALSFFFLTPQPTCGRQTDADTLAIHTQSNNQDVRALAMEMLGRTKCASERSILALVEGLSDAKPLVRMRAAGALGKLGPAAVGARDNLTKSLRDPSYAV